MKIHKRNPVNYGLCTDTITVYHKAGDAYTRAVIENAFFDYKKVQGIEKTGSREVNSALIVIPGSEQLIFPGDKVVYGVCDTVITTAQEWAAFIPVKVPGMVVAKDVDPKRWNGEIVHWEAGA